MDLRDSWMRSGTMAVNTEKSALRDISVVKISAILLLPATGTLFLKEMDSNRIIS